MKASGLVLRTTADVVDTRAIDAERGELSAHGGAQIDERLLALAAYHDRGRSGGTLDRFGHVDPDFEATRPDARSDGGDHCRRPLEARGGLTRRAPETKNACAHHTGDDAAPARMNRGHRPG